MKSGRTGLGVAERDAASDLTLVIRGGSRGLTVLLLGGVVQPWVGQVLPPLGYVWLTLVAIAAFVWAAYPRGAAGHARSWRQRSLVGCGAAVCSYLLVLPLVLSAASFVPWEQMVLTSVAAVVVGSLVGAFAPIASKDRRA